MGKACCGCLARTTEATAGTEQIKLGPAGNYKLTGIPQPSDCFLMGETSYAGQFYDADAPSVVAYSLPRDGHHRSTSGFYHNGSMNLLYVDGHVSNIKGRKTSKKSRVIASHQQILRYDNESKESISAASAEKIGS